MKNVKQDIALQMLECKTAIEIEIEKHERENKNNTHF